MRLTVEPASAELETRPDVIGYAAAWIAREECDLRAAADSARFSDKRAYERYLDQVASYLRQLESAIYDRTDRLLPLRKITPFQISAHNLDSHLLTNVELTLQLRAHGQQQLIQADLDEALLTGLPSRPSPPGQPHALDPVREHAESVAQIRRQQRQLELDELAQHSPYSLDHGLQHIMRPAAIIATSKGDRLIELVYPQFTLRAHQTIQLPAVALDLLEPLDLKCEIRWTATTTNVRGISRGQFELITVARPYALAATWPRESTTVSRAATSGDPYAGTTAVGSAADANTTMACGIIGGVNPILLAAAGELPSTKLRHRLHQAAEAISALDDSAFDNPQTLVDTIVAKYSVPATAYRGEPTIIGEPRDHRIQTHDWPHPTRMISKDMRDYTVAVTFDGDPDLIRASFATCDHAPLWHVVDHQIRTVFTVERTTPGADLEQAIRNHTAHAATHLEQTRGDTDRFHEELNALIADMVPKMVALRLAGQRQREEINLPFVALPEQKSASARQPDNAASTPLATTDQDPDALFQEVVEVLRSAATDLAASTPLTTALDTEDLMRFQLVIYLKASLRAPYLFTEESFHGQGKVDISVHWNQTLIGIIECKVWHSETHFKNGIDQVLSYVTYEDTRVAFIVFIRTQNVSQVVDTLKQTMLNHPNCADNELPAGRDSIDFRYHATADPEQEIRMVLMPMPLTTSATGTSTTRGIKRASTRSRNSNPGV